MIWTLQHDCRTLHHVLDRRVSSAEAIHMDQGQDARLQSTVKARQDTVRVCIVWGGGYIECAHWVVWAQGRVCMAYLYVYMITCHIYADTMQTRPVAQTVLPRYLGMKFRDGKLTRLSCDRSCLRETTQLEKRVYRKGY
jgi:hypothetical protein